MNLKKLNFLVLAFVLCFALSCATVDPGSCTYTNPAGTKVCFDSASSTDTDASFERACKSTETADTDGVAGISGTYDGTNACTAGSDKDNLNAKYCKDAELKIRYKTTDDGDAVNHTFKGNAYFVLKDPVLDTCESGTLTDTPSS